MPNPDKTAVLVLAEGFEEIEAITPMDVLRRAGITVTIAGIGGLQISGAHGIVVNADVVLENITDLPDALILPGGLPGANNLKNSKTLSTLIAKMHAERRLIAAICASPALVLTPAGVLNGKIATCYPGFEKEFTHETSFSTQRVVCDDNLITSRGPGTALEFSLVIVESLKDVSTANQLREGMIVAVGL